MDCEKCYVGQTRKNICTYIRFKEHLKNIKSQEYEQNMYIYLYMFYLLL